MYRDRFELPPLFRLLCIRAGGIVFIVLTLTMFPVLLLGAMLPRGPELAYMSNALDSWDIYLMDVNRGVNMRLTTSPGQDRYPAWSPGGELIAYHSDETGDYDLYVVEPDGSDARRLAAPAREIGATDAMAAWSPDGRYIAYHAYLINRESDLYVLELPTGEIYRATLNPSDDVKLAWSPDGERVAFASERENGSLDLYVMDADDLLRVARNNPPSDFELGLPGGTSTSGAVVLDALPASARRLTDTLADDWYPSWSPDGTQIAFHSDIDLNYEIYVIDVDEPDAQPRNLTNYRFADDRHPHWLPDGRIVFASNRAGSYDLYIMDADGGNLRRLTFYPDSHEDAPAWRP